MHYTNRHAQTCAKRHTQTYTLTHVQKGIHRATHSLSHIQRRTFRHTQMHTLTYTHTHIPKEKRRHSHTDTYAHRHTGLSCCWASAGPLLKLSQLGQKNNCLQYNTEQSLYLKIFPLFLYHKTFSITLFQLKLFCNGMYQSVHKDIRC